MAKRRKRRVRFGAATEHHSAALETEVRKAVQEMRSAIANVRAGSCSSAYNDLKRMERARGAASAHNASGNVQMSAKTLELSRELYHESKTLSSLFYRQCMKDR